LIGRDGCYKISENSVSQIALLVGLDVWLLDAGSWCG